MIVLIVARELHVTARVHAVRARHEPLDRVAAVVLPSLHLHLDAPPTRVRTRFGHHHTAALLVPLLHVAGFEVVTKQHGGIIYDAFVARILRSQTRTPFT